MLARYSRLGAFCLFAFLLFVWAGYHNVPKGSIHYVPPPGVPSAQDAIHDVYPPAPVNGGPVKAAQATASANPVTTIPLSSTTPEPLPTTPSGPSPNAYVFYATQNEYACSVLVNIDRLQNLFHTTHRIFVLASPKVSAPFIHALEARNVTVSVQSAPPLAHGSVGYYEDCLLKLLGFRMHEIDPTLKRVLVLDADQLIVNSLDHVFELPEVDLAAPRAYWIAKDFFSSTFMLINLSDRLWRRVEEGIKTIAPDKYDMDLANQLLGDTVMMLPGSYATPNSHWEDWNMPKWFRPEAANDTAKASGPVGFGEVAAGEEKKKQGLKRRDAPPPLFRDENGWHGVHSDNVPSTTGFIVSDATATPWQASSHSLSSHAGDHLHSSISSVSPSPTSSPSTTPDPAPAAPLDRLAPIDILSHPLLGPLQSLTTATHVLHFFALGKPWSYSLADVKAARPYAHPAFVEQWRTWRTAAREVCPTWSVKGVERVRVEVEAAGEGEDIGTMVGGWEEERWELKEVEREMRVVDVV
ncbi:hypothetical protein H2201_003487 [Coniosporium apollinis]|uniref:Nucleotide-diphospho-sugar transferase n=1 Tax=Coniosporium apollinis TaxID=61459 RepID=A0ABQ9NV76_9PEZI|nr:hypothetical protein H2201_003487 [Coniosporium apollinis]